MSHLHLTLFPKSIARVADPFDQEIFDGQIKPGGTSVASSATATNAATAMSKVTKATGTAATVATTTAAPAATGTGTGTKQHHHFRGLKNRNLWAQAS